MKIQLNEKEKTEKEEDLEIFHSIMEDVLGEFVFQSDEESSEDVFDFLEF